MQGVVPGAKAGAVNGAIPGNNAVGVTVPGNVGGGKAAGAAVTGKTATAPAAAASGATHSSVQHAFCWMCPAACGCDCCPGCSSVACLAHDYLICCGASASLVTCGVLAACALGGKAQEYGKFCGECETNAAVLECTECHEIYCQKCYDRTHARGEWLHSGRKGHRARLHKITSVRYLVSEEDRTHFMDAEQPCGECSDADRQVRATVYCLDCKEVYCHACKIKVHSKGLRVRHSRFVPLCVSEEHLEPDYLDKNFPPKPPVYERGEARPKWERPEEFLAPEDEEEAQGNHQGGR